MRTRAGLMLVAACICGFGQTDPSPHFEVASVKRAAGFGTFSGGPGSSDPERITYEGTTLEILIMGAYGLRPGRVSGPAWLGTEWYTVTAKLAPGTTADQFRQMLQNLLAERFGLVCHRVTKEVSGYDLVVAPGGPKIASTGAWPPPAAPDGTAPHMTFQWEVTDGVMHFTVGGPIGSLVNLGLVFGAAENGLQSHTPVPVINQTGLTGRFDFHLDVEWHAPQEGDVTAADISAAMEKQLGLKLIPAKIKVDTVVVDHAERVPTEN